MPYDLGKTCKHAFLTLTCSDLWWTWFFPVLFFHISPKGLVNFSSSLYLVHNFITNTFFKLKGYKIITTCLIPIYNRKFIETNNSFFQKQQCLQVYPVAKGDFTTQRWVNFGMKWVLMQKALLMWWHRARPNLTKLTDW